MSKIPFTPLAATLPSTVPFVGPETQEREMGHAFDARLGANENMFGPSPKAITAMQQAASEVWQYGDPENHDLRRALAEHHNIDPAHIMIGEGIDGLLGYLARLLIEQDTPVVTSDGAYPTFNFHVAGFGGALHKVPYVNDHEDPDALLAKARDVGAKIIYFANPDNPMGSHHSARTVQKMIDDTPPETLLLLDEAYIELAPDGVAPPLAPETPNLIRMRTFSKAYGMAGARVGYAIGPRYLIQAFDKIRNHFGMGRVSKAGAIAALQDRDYFQKMKTWVDESRDRIGQIANENGLTALPSATNFVAIDCGQDGAFAQRVLSHLIKAGIFVRMPGVAPLNRCIRVSCGTKPAMDAFAAALPAALTAARA